MNRNQKKCTGWCSPTVLYLVLSVVAVLYRAFNGAYNNQQGLTMLLIQGLYVSFWTGIMYWLCANCSSNWSWFIFLFPLILGLVFFVLFEARLLTMFPAQRIQDQSAQHGDEIYKHNTFRVDY